MKILILKYLTDTISEKELELLYDWLKFPENQELFKSMVGTNHTLDRAYSSINTENAYQKVLEASKNHKNSVVKIYNTLFKYAAILILILGTSFGLYTLLKSDASISTESKLEEAPQVVLEFGDGTLKILDEKVTSNIALPGGEVSIKQEYGKLLYAQSNKAITKLAHNQICVPYGKRFTVELTDRTVISLNAGSKLKYPQSFTGMDSREVYLFGEAYFNVEKDESRPFIVHTDKMNVRVFGTKFNVSNYSNESSASAVLTEGSIGVYSPSETLAEKDLIVLKPGQQAIIQKDSFIVRKVNIEKHVAWSSNKLHFENDRLADIIKELERHYNVSIDNKSSELDNIRYTGTFSKESIIEVLNIFRSTTNFEYRMENNKITIEQGRH